MQAYTSGLKTGKRRWNSSLTRCYHTSEMEETKLKFVSLWAGNEARTYLSTVDKDRKDSLKTMLDTLEDWTRPKSDEIAVFTHLRTLNQGNKTLSTYIQEVRRV